MRPATRSSSLGLGATILLLVLAACSGEASKEKTARPTLDPELGPDGPLYGIVMVTSGESGPTNGDPQLSFTTDDVEVTAVVPLGQEVQAQATLTFDWYSWSSFDKREKLFSHEITVSPGGQAYSQGVSPAGLAPGVYETVANLGKRQVRTPWVVREITEKASASGGGGGPLALFAPIAQAFSSEDWETPSAGNSGWDEPEAPPQETVPSGPCQLLSVRSDFLPMAGSEAALQWKGACANRKLSVSVSGPPTDVAGQTTDFGDQGFVRGRAQGCELPGGSDLPGTVMTWAGDVGEGGTQSHSTTLPDLGELLEAVIQTSEGTPTKVDPGYRILLRGMAVSMQPALGVEKLDLTVGGQVIESVGNASETSQPQPCDPGRLGAIAFKTYTVPEDPPAVIEACAKARGFDGTEAEGCIQFYTGEVWEGTITLTSDERNPQCSAIEMTARFSVGVADDGTAEGSGTFDHSGYSCEGGFTASATSGTFDITGRHQTGVFTLGIPDWQPKNAMTPRFPVVGTMEIPVSDEAGQADIRRFGVGYRVSLTCQTCGGAG